MVTMVNSGDLKKILIILDSHTLYLFYTMSYSHSQAILPIWYRVRNVLPRNTTL